MSERKQRVALIGLGSIGTSVADMCAGDADAPFELVGAVVRDAGRARSVSVPRLTRLDELLALEPDVIAEAAGHAALQAFGPSCLRASVPLVLLSVGALADAAFEAELRRAARDGGTTATVASGGVAALDMIASAARGGLDEVVHTIVKPPAALGVQAYGYTEIYRGPARAAAVELPRNANVAAAVALAGLGLDRSEVVVAADPAATGTRQTIAAAGAFGRLRVEIESRPSSGNPRTAAVVAMSLVHALRRRSQTIVIG